ncbi:MAG: glutamine-hydrolyzing carbamoyl-phosphate synthase small subunit [Lentisphaeraceae bacterium]|nr:glutamine-hydrolyzing carbamoyl-phosphate synthase small subunit [Lentisphaeraceae bacterium]
MSKWNWKEKREKKAFLALEDGTIFRGYSVGAAVDSLGEAVFNTGLTGYQEILSDPSYAGQFINMTYPEIGICGTTSADMESRKTFCNGFILHNENQPSNFRNEVSLMEFCKNNEIPALAGIDTRALTLKLRADGAMKSFMCTSGEVSEEEAVQRAKEWAGLEGQDYAAKVTCSETFEWDSDDAITTSWGIADELPETDLHVVAYDFGIKWNILRCLRRQGMKVTVVPATTPASEVLAMNPDGVFLSNGPADPQAVTYAIDAAKEILGKKPMMGICLGHQILGLACGAKTYKMKFGHHGCNHPVQDLETKKIEITSQNHNFAIDFDTVDSDVLEVTHMNLNDNTVAGIRHKQYPMFAVQYHPESAPGPHDPYYLFERFRKLILDNK